MKKTIKSLLAIAVAAFAFTACSDVPEPYAMPSEKQNEPVAYQGEGTQASPFTIADAIAKCKEVGQSTSTEKYYIKGIANAEYTVSNYKNIDMDLVDAEGSANVFKVYHCKGNNAKDIPVGYQVHKGDVFVVYGPVVNYKGNTPETSTGAYIVSINGVDPAGGSETPEVQPGTPAGTGTQADPFNVAAAVAKCKEVGETATTEEFYVKGIVDADCTIANDNYKNATFDMVDEEGASEKFKAFRVLGPDGKKLKAGYKIAKGATVIVYGKVVNYKGNTPETVQATNPAYNGTLVSVNGQAPELDEGSTSGGETGGGGTSGGGETITALTNGDFEAWSSDAQPTGWKSASSASSATLAKSTDAHGGSYSCNVNGGNTANKRLATQEITLAAGTYNFAFYAKATTANVAQVRSGYAIVKNGTISNSDYKYNSTYFNINNNEWTLIENEFTLDAETVVCLLVMNPKAQSGKTSGEDILVDDATLTKK